MKFKKEILKVGEYLSPDGVVKITPERLSHFTDQFNRMKKMGLKIPVPYGHLSAAKPQTYEEKEYWDSRFNAGYIEDLPVENDTLYAIVDIPREEDASRVGKSIQEVSPQIETAFRDGKGRIWNDVITHLALVTHPVVPNQSNFVEIADDPVPAYAMRLSLKNYIYKLDTKDGGMVKKNIKSEDTTTDDIPDLDTDLDAGGTDIDNLDQDLHDALAGIGLFVPEEALADVSKFKLALLASALTLKQRIDEVGNEDEDENAFQDLHLPEKEQDKQENEGSPGGEESNEFMTTPGGNNSQLQEQQPQYSMSLQKLQTQNAFLLKKLEESDKLRMKSEIRNLLETGRISAVMAQKLNNELGTYNLSLNAKGEARPNLVAAKIEDFKLLPEGAVWSNDEKVRLRNVAEEALPSEFTQLNDNDAEAIAERQLRQSGRGFALGA